MSRYNYTLTTPKAVRFSNQFWTILDAIASHKNIPTGTYLRMKIEDTMLKEFQKELKYLKRKKAKLDEEIES